MSSDKKTSEELEDKIDRLVQQMGMLGLQLQKIRHCEAHAPTREGMSEQEQCQALLLKIVGQRVLIAVKGDHKGKQGIITRHAGDMFYPVNWHVKLPDGSETRKNKGSFKLLPRQDASKQPVINGKQNPAVSSRVIGMVTTAACAYHSHSLLDHVIRID